MPKTASTQRPTQLPKLLVNRQDAETKIEARIQIGRELLNRQIQNIEQFKAAEGDSYKWFDYNVDLLRSFFSTSEIADNYTGVVGLGYFTGDVERNTLSLPGAIKLHSDHLEAKIHALESIKTRLELYPLDESVQTSHAATRPVVPPSDLVFIVHGHNEHMRENVARFLEKLDLKPIILHEQPNAGQTIIEKVENNADVSFAVVLLTSDDVGASKENADVLQPRARQNVVLELGFFLGRLGRERVCAIHEEGVEIPSDFSGVLYIPFDTGGAWKLKLAKELKHSGIEVDMNKAI